MTPLSALLSAAFFMAATAPTAQAESYKWDTVAMGGGGYATGVIPSKSERDVLYMRTDVGGA